MTLCRFAIVAATALLLSFGCEARKAEPSARSHPPEARPAGVKKALTSVDDDEYRRSCPVASEGVDVSVEDTPDGVALTFVTLGDLELLRDRAYKLAVMYSTHRGRHLTWHAMHESPLSEMRHPNGGPMPAVDVKPEEIPGGARLTLKPEDPDLLDELRSRARIHQKRMQSGECWVLRSYAQTVTSRAEK